MKKRKRRLGFTLFVITALFISVFGYVVYLKTTKGDEYEQRALRQYTNRYDVQLYPARGAIVDRNMKELAVSVPVYNVILDPIVLNENSRNEETRKKNIETTLDELNRRFGIPMAELLEYMETDGKGQLKKPSRYIKFQQAKGITRIEADELKALKLKGVWLEEDSKRAYPYNTLAANVVGFIRGDAFWGLESYYNDYLTGDPGRAFVTYTNTATPVINKVPPRNGNTVITTIDTNLQEYAEEALKNAAAAFQPENGALICMDPKTGEVLAWANYPTFDANKPMEPVYLDDPGFEMTWEASGEEERIELLNTFWRNFSTTNSFEPGSIFKPIVIAAALDEEVISLSDTFFCQGKRQFYDREISCHYKPGHGIQTVEEVLANSCNLAMMDIGALLGPELFYKHFADFGFGEKTEIDLPAEEDVRLWVYGEKEFKNPVNLATSSFGQGSSCTPIQALNAFSAVINGGNVMKPYIVSQVVDDSGNVITENKPTIVRRILSNDTSDTLRYMLKSVVDYGTGKKAKIPGYSIGGKTGTGEQGVRSQDRVTLTFIGYLPVEDPQILALALLDNPLDSELQGSATAAPMLKEFLEKAILYLGIKPSNADEVEEDMFIAADSVTVPDFIGMSMADATEILLAGGLRYDASGGGNVITTQWPKTGTKVDRNTVVTLYTKKMEGEIPTVPVPNVVGLSSGTAFEMLIDNSFVPAFDEGEDVEGKIITSQDPAAGRHAYPGTDVRLTFALPETD